MHAVPLRQGGETARQLAFAPHGASRAGLDRDLALYRMAQPTAANRLVDDLDIKSKALARDSGMGAASNDIAPGPQHFPAGQYVILYRDLKDGIEVVRYIHGMRRLQDFF